jgi:hypothetical protein
MEIFLKCQFQQKAHRKRDFRATGYGQLLRGNRISMRLHDTDLSRTFQYFIDTVVAELPTNVPAFPEARSREAFAAKWSYAAIGPCLLGRGWHNTLRAKSEMIMYRKA